MSAIVTPPATTPRDELITFLVATVKDTSAELYLRLEAAKTLAGFLR